MKPWHTYAGVRLGIFLLVLVASCAGSDSRKDSIVGQLEITLIDRSPSGVTYRLRHATFKISGTSSATLSSETDPDAPTLGKELVAGDYLVRLNSEWFLERQRADGTFERVKAALTSANPVSFTINDQQTTSVQFRFRAGDDVLELGHGRVSVSIDVEETPRACRLHADCASRACDTYAANGRGECIDSSRILYVAGYPSDCTFPGSGTLGDPFCSMAAALAEARAAAKDVIRVFPAYVEPFTVSAQRLLILGSAGEGGETRVYEPDTIGVSVINGAHVVIDGMALSGRTGFYCGGVTTRGVLRRSNVSGEGVALRAQGCELELDRVTVNWLGRAIELNDTHFSIINTVVSGWVEWPVPIAIASSDGSCRFSTVNAYREMDVSPRGLIDCGSSSVLIQDSIVEGDSHFDDTGSNFRGACTLERVVVGDDPISSSGAIHETAEMSSDFQLRDSAQNRVCCIDRAQSDTAPHWDILGTHRPQGSGFDIGAFELARDHGQDRAGNPTRP